MTGQGCDALLAAVAGMVDEAPPVDIHAPAGDGAAVAWLYRHGRVIGRHDAEDGAVWLSVSLTAQALGQFEQLFPASEIRGN